jgi:hypothetical protein
MKSLRKIGNVTLLRTESRSAKDPLKEQGKEVVKEQHLEKRISHLRANDLVSYQTSLDTRPREFQQV